MSDISEKCKHTNTKIWEPHLAGARKCLSCDMVYNPNMGGWYVEGPNDEIQLSNLKSLKELFEKHGSVWFSWPQTPNVKQFKPLGFTSDQKYIIGELFRDRVMCWPYGVDEKGFVLHQEVKQKKIYYQYVYKARDGKIYTESELYLGDDEFRESMCDFKFQWFKKVEPGIEVEE